MIAISVYAPVGFRKKILAKFLLRADLLQKKSAGVIFDDVGVDAEVARFQ